MKIGLGIERKKMNQIFKTSNYSKFKKNNSWPFSNEEKELAKAIKHAYSVECSLGELEIGTHYDSFGNRKQGIRKIYGWKMCEDLNGESYEVQIWHRPKLEAQRADN